MRSLPPVKSVKVHVVRHFWLYDLTLHVTAAGGFLVVSQWPDAVAVVVEYSLRKMDSWLEQLDTPADVPRISADWSATNASEGRTLGL